MKALATLTFALTALTSSIGSAQEQRMDMYGKFVCQEISPKGHAARTMVLKRIGDQGLEEGVEYRYQFLLFEQGHSSPLLATVVTVTNEDVMFNFEAKKHDLSGIIFLDEMDQTSLTLGNDEMRFDCGR